MSYLDTTGLSAVWEKIKAALAAKQDALTAGDNVTIEGNVISAAGPAGMSVGTDGYVYQEVSE